MNPRDRLVAALMGVRGNSAQQPYAMGVTQWWDPSADSGAGRLVPRIDEPRRRGDGNDDFWNRGYVSPEEYRARGLVPQAQPHRPHTPEDLERLRTLPPHAQRQLVIEPDRLEGMSYEQILRWLQYHHGERP